MKKLMHLIFVFVVANSSINANVAEFDHYFKDKTMRVDYFHSGTATEEHFAIDRIVSDGAWAGSLSHLVDEINFGLYQFDVINLADGNLIYSRGFASVFGEWQTIPEAGEQWGTFHESIRFPWPLKPVKIQMKKRNEKNNFTVIWETNIDPASRKVTPADLISPFKTKNFLVNGSPKEKVDIVILGDGYTAKEMDKFHKDIERLTASLFAVEPFKSRKNEFNVRAVETPSATSGVNKPHPGIFNRTPLTVHYSSFDSERYALSYDNRAIREAASAVPYDFMFLLINERTYGGGGIYQLYASVSVDNQFSDYIFVHEFGHHFAALADEYYSSSVSYQMPEITVEPWEANITALLDGKLKWQDMVKEGTPIPTPWNKEVFDKHAIEIQKERERLRAANSPESVLEDLFNKQKKEETRMISEMENKGKIGAFEGASYYQYGMYRSSIDCIMYTRNSNDFCPVCQRAISTVIDQYTK
ncbi:MAG: IgA Peptidase M64 [Bacteroidetes bacterium]|nr:IgA Peptidase M64 [Bacteroidota bacterium]